MQTSRGAQTQSSIISDSGSFIEDDNPEQLTIQQVDTIKIMADVEEDVKRLVADQITQLQAELKVKDEIIEKMKMRDAELQTSRGAQSQSSIISDSGSFDDEDNSKKMTIHQVDTIKIMADVEEDVRRLVADQFTQLQAELRLKDEIINKMQKRENVPDSVSAVKGESLKDENDNFQVNINPYEDQLVGQGERSLINSTTPKLLRLQSVQDQAKSEMKR